MNWQSSVVTNHLCNVFVEGELDEKSNVQNLHIAGSDKPVKFCSLDVDISAGYRVKSREGGAVVKDSFITACVGNKRIGSFL